MFGLVDLLESPRIFRRRVEDYKLSVGHARCSCQGKICGTTATALREEIAEHSLYLATEIVNAKLDMQSGQRFQVRAKHFKFPLAPRAIRFHRPPANCFCEATETLLRQAHLTPRRRFEDDCRSEERR